MSCLLVTGIYPPEIGGPAIVIETLANELRAKGHMVTVVTYGPTDEVTPDVVRVSRQGSVMQRYLHLLRAVRSRLGPEVVVFATDVFSVGIPTRFALIGRQNRFVLRLGGEWCWEAAVTKGGLRVTLRDFWKSHAGGWQMQLKRWNYRWILGRAARVVVTSDLLKEVIIPIVPRVASRIVTVPNLARSAECPAHSSGPAHDPLRLVYVGRFAPVKNLPFLARVFKQIVTSGLRVECIFVGDGPELAETKMILQDVPGMRFLGSLPHVEAMQFLSEADVYVLPSLSDICPNTVVEALACGIPCLVTSEHGLPPGIGGLMEVSPQDLDAWVAAIQKLSQADVYQRLRESIRVPSITASLTETLTNL